MVVTALKPRCWVKIDMNPGISGWAERQASDLRKNCGKKRAALPINTMRKCQKKTKISFLYLFPYLKKSSLQKTCPFLAKHLSVSALPQSLQLRHLACHVRSSTFRINLSRISSWQPPHLGIVAEI